MRPITVRGGPEPEAAVLWKQAKAEMVEREEGKKGDDVPEERCIFPGDMMSCSHRGIESLISWLWRAAKSI